MKIENISPSITEPVTLADLKAHLRIEHDADDGYLLAVASAARDVAERYVDQIIAPQQFRLTLDSFSQLITLPRSPVLSVESVAYTDTNGAAQTVVDFSLIGDELAPAYGASWPTTQDGYDKVEIEFTAGMTSSPPSIRQAILLIAGSFYDQREDHSPLTLSDVPWSSKALLAGYKRGGV